MYEVSGKDKAGFANLIAYLNKLELSFLGFTVPLWGQNNTSTLIYSLIISRSRNHGD